MVVLPDDDNTEDQSTDYAQCPFCRKWIGELSDDVSDENETDIGEAVASCKCPNCNETVAVVRESFFYLQKFKQEKDTENNK